ncbi:tRNA pseudouridine(55) synthase TruB [Paenibacillus sp. ACRRX]|uniref:tRNA pseudouridine(55) synthase TruB n=1 Tax=Paenibacillus sp. ACRRX TaxID=2918206 RepID=UPI001EF73B2A|nr:tRNA pseudouridine(55) synthase TruB [Paenibacillus sp. ACRRX]MCG7407447.1 tRNA pseudouridine(55) synthase TruB [Paenibacillus sp. ACRRX]
MTSLNGILPVWKPEGWTSHDVVAKVRGIVREKRIGHTGTLDPQVTGVLPLCVGKATRIVEYLQELPKQYEAVLRFGVATDTEDSSGTVMERMDAAHLTEERIREVMASFSGQIDQVPPMYSAVKVNGQRLYELAREGKTVERKSRTVTIHDIEVLDMNLGVSEPTVRFRVTCSKGTYIRTLCVDIGRALEVPSTMESLIRTMSAQYTAEQCYTIEQIQQAANEGSVEALLQPVEQAMSHVPAIHMLDAFAHYAVQGRGIPFRACSFQPLTNQLYRLYDEQEAFYGLFHVPVEDTCLRPVKVFLPSTT